MGSYEPPDAGAGLWAWVLEEQDMLVLLTTGPFLYPQPTIL